MKLSSRAVLLMLLMLLLAFGLAACSGENNSEKTSGAMPEAQLQAL